MNQFAYMFDSFAGEGSLHDHKQANINGAQLNMNHKHEANLFLMKSQHASLTICS